MEILINNVTTGVLCSGNSSQNTLLVITSSISSLGTGVRVESGGQMLLGTCAIMAGGTGIEVGGPNLTTGSPSYLSAAVINMVNSDIGVQIDGGTMDMRTANIFGARKGAEITATGTPYTLVSDVVFTNSSELDLDVLATIESKSVISVMACAIDSNKVRNLHRIPMMWHSLSLVPHQEKHIFSGDIHIGDYITPTRMIVGRGEGNFPDMSVFQTSGDTWNDMIGNIKTQTPFGIWPELEVGAALYVGHIDSSFAGLRMRLVSGGSPDGKWEYYTSTGWVDCPIMCIAKNYPFTHHGLITFDHVVDDMDFMEHYVLFGPLPDWTPVILNGIMRYWVRYRCLEATGPIATIQCCMPILDSAITSEEGSQLLNYNLLIKAFA
jgi:hypothetical protein